MSLIFFDESSFFMTPACLSARMNIRQLILNAPICVFFHIPYLKKTNCYAINRITVASRAWKYIMVKTATQSSKQYANKCFGVCCYLNSICARLLLTSLVETSIWWGQPTTMVSLFPIQGKYDNYNRIESLTFLRGASFLVLRRACENINSNN